jgi:hypothetical protein
MTNREAARASAGERVRRMTHLPREVANLSDELAALRTDVAGLRRDVIDLGRRLPGVGEAAPRAASAEAPGAESRGAVEGAAGETSGDAVPAPPGLEEEPFDDGIELFAERMAVLEDGLDDVAQRLEGMARDSVNLVAAKLEHLTQRVDALAARPSLTQEQLEEALARIANLSRSPSR